jgi:hypothetical protein
LEWCRIRTHGGPSTLNNAYAQIITSITLSAQDHVNLADAITLQVVDVLKSIEKRSEDTKKKVRPVASWKFPSDCLLRPIANGFLSKITVWQGPDVLRAPQGQISIYMSPQPNL